MRHQFDAIRHPCSIRRYSTAWKDRQLFGKTRIALRTIAGTEKGGSGWRFLYAKKCSFDDMPTGLFSSG
jgi:hypothetical protein